ncbi:MAG TPA: hypothetical protein VHH15_17965 [Actinophytocola sp.]|nr:hypothetical protein [Actinophytocola sp.]
MPPILPAQPPAGNNGGIEHTERLPLPPWAVAAGLGYAALGATFASHSVPALVAVLVPGVAALVVVALVRRPRVPGGRFGRRHRAWLVWALAFTAWEVASLVLGELSFSLLLDPVLELYPLRVAGWVLWLSGLWLLVRR